MKNFIYTLLILPLLVFVLSNGAAQTSPEWSIYFAFEDATQAKDTVWIVWHDSASVTSMDQEYGEVPVDLDSTNFNVWFYQFDGIPFDHFVKQFNGHSNIEIYANNHVLPITMTWDSSLFHSNVLYEVLGYGVNYARLDNEYFWGVFNNPFIANMFDMLITDHAEMPWFWWGSHDHFPLMVYIKTGEQDNEVSVDVVWQTNLEIYPNPASDRLYVKSEEPLRAVKIYDLSGRIVEKSDLFRSYGEDVSIDLSSIHAAGMYFVSFELSDGRMGVKKFLKE